MATEPRLHIQREAFFKIHIQMRYTPVFKDTNKVRFCRVMKTAFILALIVAACICSEVDLGARRLEKTEDSNPSCCGFEDSGEPFIHTSNTPTSVERKFFISYPENYEPGLLALMENRIREILEAFVENSLSIEECLKTYIVAQFLNEKEELMANVFMRPTDYTAKDGEGTITCTRKVIGIYSVYVPPTHRGNKLSMVLLKEALEHVLKEKNMDMHDTLLALCISLYDSHMEVAYALYRNNGFMKAALIAEDPYDYILRGKELVDLESPEEVIEKYDPEREQSDEQLYMMMLAEMRTFMQIQENSSCTKGGYEEHHETAKKIRAVLEICREKHVNKAVLPSPPINQVGFLESPWDEQAKMPTLTGQETTSAPEKALET
jgi:GNAT superfamily N-acetyltransferase